MDASIQLALKVAASAAVGLLLGLEREWAHKEIGVRSFAVATLLGTLSWQVASTLAFVQFGIIALMIFMANAYTFWKDQNLQVTTSFALAATNILGMAIGSGNYFLAFAGAIAIAALLAWKTELVTLSGKLTEKEIRGALLLAFISVVVYPLLPAQEIDPWKIINLRSIWLTVILVSAIKFLNYVLLRIYGERGLRYSSLLGGLVNSAAMSFFLGQEVQADAKTEEEAPANMLLAGAAMILRNWALVLLFTLPKALPRSLPTVIVLVPVMLVAGGVAALAIWRTLVAHQQKSGEQAESVQPGQKASARRTGQQEGELEADQAVSEKQSARQENAAQPDQEGTANESGQRKKQLLQSPLSLRSVLLFALIFFTLTVLSGAGRILFGSTGFLVVIVVGALASAASSAVLLGQELARGAVGAMPSAIAMYLATVAGLLENAVIFWIVARKPATALRILLLTLPVIASGVVMVVLVNVFHW